MAVTVCAAVMVTTQEPVPLQPAPLQPVKIEPPAAKASRVTVVLGTYDSVQSAPQEMPAGELSTAPDPVPVLATVKV